MPSLKERIEEILYQHRDHSPGSACNSTYDGKAMCGHASALLSLLNERTDEVVKVLRVAVDSAPHAKFAGTTQKELCDFDDAWDAHHKSALESFDTAALSLKPDEERG